MERWSQTHLDSNSGSSTCCVVLGKLCHLSGLIFEMRSIVSTSQCLVQDKWACTSLPGLARSSCTHSDRSRKARRCNGNFSGFGI